MNLIEFLEMSVVVITSLQRHRVLYLTWRQYMDFNKPLVEFYEAVPFFYCRTEIFPSPGGSSLPSRDGKFRENMLKWTSAVTYTHQN